MTPDSAREALCRRLYAVWPEWTPGFGPVPPPVQELHDLGRIEVEHSEPYRFAVRVNMRLAA